MDFNGGMVLNKRPRFRYRKVDDGLAVESADFARERLGVRQLCARGQRDFMTDKRADRERVLPAILPGDAKKISRKKVFVCIALKKLKTKLENNISIERYRRSVEAR